MSLTILLVLCAASLSCVGVKARMESAADLRHQPSPLGGKALFVEFRSPDGSVRNIPVGRTLAQEISAQDQGEGPDGVLWLTWQEDGLPHYTLSEDGGQTWRKKKRNDRAILLKSGSAYPDEPMPEAPIEMPAEGRLFLVQGRIPWVRSMFEALAKAGCTDHGHIPHASRLIRCNESGAASDLRELPFIVRVEPYHCSYRLSRGVKQWLDEPMDKPEEARRLRAITFTSGDKDQIASAVTELGGEYIPSTGAGTVIDVVLSRTQAKSLACHDSLEYLGTWSPPVDAMNLARKEKGSGADILAPYLPDDRPENHCGEGVRGEIVEGCFDSHHPEFEAQWITHDEVTCDENGVWHGTQSFGIAFASGDGPGENGKSAMGLLPCGKGIMADKNLRDTNWGGIGRLEFTRTSKNTHKASFQSNSWGQFGDTDYDVDARDMDEIVFEVDLPILQAAGNEGHESDVEARIIQDRTEAKNIITVGGILHGNNLDTSKHRWCNHECPSFDQATCEIEPQCTWDGTVCKGSYFFCGSIGPTWDLRIKPDVSNWMDFIFTTFHDSPTCPEDCWTQCFSPTAPDWSPSMQCMVNWNEQDCETICPNINQYTPAGGGTSAATPMSAGVLGLIVDLWGDGYNGQKNPWGVQWLDPPSEFSDWERQPHSSTMKALLINSALQYPFTHTQAEQSPDMDRVHQGWGRPNALEALRRAAGSLVVDEEVTLTEGMSQEWQVTVHEHGTDLKVTLVYNDPDPTLPAEGKLLQNDIDLKVVSPPHVPDGEDPQNQFVDIYCGNYGLHRGVDSIPVDTVASDVSPYPDCDDPGLFDPFPVCGGGNPFPACMGGWWNAMDTYKDSLNNVENVFIQNPEAGDWRVEVKAYDVTADAVIDTPEEDVTFALVVTGDSLAVPGSVDNLILGCERCKDENDDPLPECKTLELQWDPDCGGGVIYSIYRAPLTGNYDHNALIHEKCDVAANTAVIDLDCSVGSEYFLVVPDTGSREGSYGLGEDDLRRIPAPYGGETGACSPQDPDLIDECSP